MKKKYIPWSSKLENARLLGVKVKMFAFTILSGKLLYLNPIIEIWKNSHIYIKKFRGNQQI
jgi:hypothetical protein